MSRKGVGSVTDASRFVWTGSIKASAVGKRDSGAAAVHCGVVGKSREWVNAWRPEAWSKEGRQNRYFKTRNKRHREKN